MRSAIEKLNAFSGSSSSLGLTLKDIGEEILGPAMQAGDIGSIGAYRVVEIHGRGSMGIVLKAIDSMLNRLVAIKVMHPLLAVMPEARERFLREARTAAAVQDDNLVTIHSVDNQGKLPFIVMEFVAGESLQQRIDRGRIPFDEITRLAKEIARGLSAAHTKGLVHRDIKPSNILLTAETGRAKVADFGLARAIDDTSLTREGTIAGTPEFMSPEQAHGQAIDHHSDLFSLGLVLHAMVSGSSPLRGQTTLDTVRRICDESPPNLRDVDPKLPTWFCDLVSCLLEKEIRHRPNSAAEVIRWIENERPLARSHSNRRDRRKNSPLLIVASLGLVALGAWWAISGGFFIGNSQLPL